MDDIYKNIEEFHPNKKRKILILFHDMMPPGQDVVVMS